MEFNDKIKQFSERVVKIKDTALTEESTKMSLIVPLFQILGYDVFNLHLNFVLNILLMWE